MPEPKSPVVPGLEPYELIYAKDQPEYMPLPVLRNPTGIVLSRWELTAEDRALIAEGADIYVSAHANFQPLQPLSITISRPPDPEEMEREWELKKELDMRLAAAARTAAAQRVAAAVRQAEHPPE